MKVIAYEIELTHRSQTIPKIRNEAQEKNYHLDVDFVLFWLDNSGLIEKLKIKIQAFCYKSIIGFIFFFLWTKFFITSINKPISFNAHQNT